MNIDLRIDRLVFEGVTLTAAQAAKAGAAAESELSRLFTREPQLERLRSAGAVARIDAPHIALTASNDPGTLGVHIARAVHGALGARK